RGRDARLPGDPGRRDRAPAHRVHRHRPDSRARALSHGLAAPRTAGARADQRRPARPAVRPSEHGPPRRDRHVQFLRRGRPRHRPPHRRAARQRGEDLATHRVFLQSGRRGNRARPDRHRAVVVFPPARAPDPHDRGRLQAVRGRQEHRGGARVARDDQQRGRRRAVPRVCQGVHRPMTHSRRLAAIVATLVMCMGVLFYTYGRSVAARSITLPVSDQEFWQLVEDFSEPNGYFRSDNFLSNENAFQHVIPRLQSTLPRGGVYVGVGPEQNFTYLVALRPKLAFIVDIRRGNLDEHLLYKAFIEMSADRADFLSRLFARPRPGELAANAPVETLFSAYED